MPTIVTAHIFCACQGSRARRERGSLREKSRASGPGAGGIVRVGKLKLTFHCFFVCVCVCVCVCAKYFWLRETISPVVFLKKCGYPGFFLLVQRKSGSLYFLSCT